MPDAECVCGGVLILFVLFKIATYRHSQKKRREPQEEHRRERQLCLRAYATASMRTQRRRSP